VNQSATAAAEERKLGGVSVSSLDTCLLWASVLLGLVHSWMSRYAMNPDGMSYLDLGDSFFSARLGPCSECLVESAISVVGWQRGGDSQAVDEVGIPSGSRR
jgi:hypothetical protein